MTHRKTQDGSRKPFSSNELASDGHRDFLRKCDHVGRLLLEQRVLGHPPAVANAWALAFSDEGDPTFSVLEWIEAGWTDPLLVDAALRICGSRSVAEACMLRLGRDVGERYEHEVIADLARAMTDADEISRPQQDA